MVPHIFTGFPGVCQHGVRVQVLRRVLEVPEWVRFLVEGSPRDPLPPLLCLSFPCGPQVPLLHFGICKVRRPFKSVEGL